MLEGFLLDLASFIIYVIVVTVSGVLSPGPLTIATLIHGAKGGLKAGLNCALGHMLVELPLAVFIGLGLLNLMGSGVKRILEIVGGLALIGFGMLQLRGVLRSENGSSQDVSAEDSMLPVSGSALLTGVTLTGLNPYFILWWLSIGSALIYEALNLGLVEGLAIMYLAHVWMDYAWLGLIAHLSGCGRRVLGRKIYRYILIGFSIALVVFGVLWIASAIGVS